MITCRLTNKGAKSMVGRERKNQSERSKEQGQKEGGVANYSHLKHAPTFCVCPVLATRQNSG